MSSYKITLDNGVWYVVESNIRNTEDFMRYLYNNGDAIHIFKVVDKSLFSNTDHVAIHVDKICSVEWRGVTE
mgnify:CR=1 FL=1